ncbi:MAG: alpha/beta fold hydrolase [Lachnospiraceae bacterium]|nr:alpha/beta fold hydrolase [Lachnospiraceae bacterium]
MVIYDDGIALDFSLEIPEDGREKHPLVIIIHGLTGNREEAQLVTLSRKLGELGFATLRADLYGHGASGGAFRDHTVFKWISNIIKLIDYARGQRAFSRLFLCGHSQGGLAVLLAAAMERDRTDGVIALAPALTIPARARKGALFGLIFDPGRVPEEFEFSDGPLSGNYVRTAQLIHAEDAEKYEGPVLFIHGEADEIVPAEVSVRAAQRYKGAQLVIIPGDSHDFDRHADKAAQAAGEWLLQRL